MECAAIVSNNGDYGSELSCRIVTSRKEHTCCECREKINIGDRYERYKGVYDWGISEFKTCVNCLSLRDAFFDRWTFTDIWHDFYEHVIDGYGEELKWSALSKLTEPAKDMAFDYIEMAWDGIDEGEEP